MYSATGNVAFMTCVVIGAILSTIGIASLGLTTLSLAILIVSVVSSILVGKAIENRFQRLEDEKLEAATQLDAEENDTDNV